MVDTNEIQRRMAEIRQGLEEDVDDIVVSVQEITDWRAFVKSYPWKTLALAAAVGFIIVPSRPVVIRAEPHMLASLMGRKHLTLAGRDGPVRNGGLFGALVSVAAATAFRTAMTAIADYAGKHWKDLGISNRNR